MATLRQWLDAAGFDWKRGVILWQPTDDETYPGWSESSGAEYVKHDHEVLDREFNGDSGAPRCPRIVAMDLEVIYFPATYDWSTWLEKVYTNLNVYLDYQKHRTPYPCGN